LLGASPFERENMRRATHVLAPVLSLIVGGVFVVACGGDDSSSTPGAEVDAGSPDTGSGDASNGTKDSAPLPEPGECEGKADGTACGSATSSACDGPDTCKAGACEKNFAAAATECGAAPTACTEQGTCDGAGKCNGKAKTAGTACGDATADECTAADTCDGAGECLKNDKVDGTTCGDATNVACNQADTCVAGVCTTNVTADGAFCQDCVAGAGKCGLCATGACPNLCEAPTSKSLETSFNRGNSLNGAMFEIDAVKDVMILAIDVSNQGVANSIEIYTHAGAIAGTTATAAAWTLRQTTNVPATMGRVPLGTDLFVPLTAGTNSFYVTHTSDQRIDYTDGSNVGDVYVNDDTLTIKQGYGKVYPFGADYFPRIWNGALRYVPGVPTTYAGGETDHGEMFDVKATATTSVRALSANLPAGDHTMRVYFHPGTFVGTEATAAAWTAIGGDIAVKSAGPGVPTAIPLKIDVSIPAATTYAFYVTTTGTTSMTSTTGAAVGTLASAAGALEVYEGSGIAYPFGTKTVAARKPNVTVYHGNCN
jgi:hypothetical protein